MTIPIQRYPLDRTGINPDNLVVGELHMLSSRETRAVAPTYGAFFSDRTLRVYDNSTNQALTRGVHYQCVDLLQEASMMTGKEISMVILILDQTVSNVVRINYQVLGGAFQNDAAGILNLYETAIKDDRPVSWINLLNKPTEYNPTIHRHLLEDVIGFEPVVAALERVRNAIILSDVPAFEALIDWFNSHVDGVNNPHRTTQAQVGLSDVENLQVVSTDEIDQGIAVHKYVTYDRLLYAFRRLALFEVYEMVPSVTVLKEGYTLTVNINTSNVKNDTRLYWNLTHISTQDADFDKRSGTVVVNNNFAKITISIREDNVLDPDEQFRVSLHAESPLGVIVATTVPITIKDMLSRKQRSIIDLMDECCLFSPGLLIDPTSMFIIGSKNHDTQKHRFLSAPVKRRRIPPDIIGMMNTPNLYSWRKGIDGYSTFVFGNKNNDVKIRRFT
jgi:hypothetical protein